MNQAPEPLWALLSVSNKDGITDFARALVDHGYRLLSTGGTAEVLRNAGLEVTSVSEVTGFPEIMDGRVKTLHPVIHTALLARRDRPDDRETMQEHGVPDVRVVVSNLYPFDERVSESTPLEEAVELVDIGGPTMVRAAAKNSAHMTIVVDPADYAAVAEQLPEPGEQLRASLSAKAFRHTAAYDAVIATYFSKKTDTTATSAELSLHLVGGEPLRYGENPHQRAMLYRSRDANAHGGLEQLHGKALSYNNIVDLDAALDLVDEFDRPAACVIKHTNAAGCATADSIDEAFDNALACDPMSAFGGIFALNEAVTSHIANVVNEGFYEVVAAPSFDEDALEILKSKKNLRLIRVPTQRARLRQSIRATALGYLVQDVDPRIVFDREELEVATSRAPSDEEWASLEFAWRVAKHVKSNAIVLASGTRTIGLGAGQMSRVDAVKIAVEKRRVLERACVLASDAFFPFRDGIDAAAEAGVTAVIQPGGSRRDGEVIEACDELGLAMVMTGTRHFRH